MGKFDELFSSFDYIDEIIYIADMDTYDLVYCNKSAKRILIPDRDNTTGKCKCYKCLQGLEHPCIFCNNEELKKKKRSIWGRQNPHTGKFYLLHDSVITVEGKDYRMELAVDASHMETAAAYTRQKLEAENHLTDCVRRLVKSDDFSDSVDAVLQTVLNFYNGERAYLFQFDWEEQIGINTYEICAHGVTPEIDNLKRVPVEKMAFWISIFSRQSVVVIEDLEKLKGIPERQAEYDTLSIQGIKSIISVPIFNDGQLTGFVGVDNPGTNFDNTDFFVNIAYFIGAELEKNNVVMELENISYHDPLTGVYNRKGFEQITGKLKDSNRPLGFAMIDIDNFKMINDSHGHETGDEILKEVAAILENVFRSEDIVFRMGGDEFAVILNDCREDAWNTICKKIQLMHSVMCQKHEELTVTLSVGICFAEKNYHESMYRLADEALYETKRNGRAGCTMINEATGEKHHWNDDSISAQSRNVLEYNSTGLFKVVYPIDRKTAPEMICSDITREIFDIPAESTPEANYSYWADRVDSQYQDVLDKARRFLFEKGQAECTYQWNHPTLGKIFIRTSGTSEVVDGEQIIYGYHHSLKDTTIIEKEDDNKVLLEAVSSSYFCSYFVDLVKDTYYPLKKSPNEKYLQINSNPAASLENFVSVLVHPDDKARVRKFLNLKTLSERLKNEAHLDCEYYSMAEKVWCRASFFPVNRDENGCITRAMFAVSLLDAVRAREAEEGQYNKKSIKSLYNNVPGGLVMYEWDGVNFRTLHLSRFYVEQYGDDVVCDDDRHVVRPDFKRVHPDDLEGLEKAIDAAINESHYLEYVYRIWNRKYSRYDWVKINAVSEPQSDGTALIYAMFSDVTGQKEAELGLLKKQASLVAALGVSHQLCYEYDPKTHVEECLVEDNVFHMPRIIENYPDSIMETVHPDDREKLLGVMNSVDKGEREAGAELRLLNDGRYRWYSYLAKGFYDTEKGHRVAIISVMDITEHTEVVQTYEARMKMLLSASDDTLNIGTVNLTQNSFSVIHVQEDVLNIVKRVSTIDELFDITSAAVVDKADRDAYRQTFNRKKLIEMAENGHMHVQMECAFLYPSTRHYEWIRTCVEMLRNPSTGDVVGVCYSRSIQNTMITNKLLEKTLELDYPLAAVVDTNSNEYYLFNSDEGQYCVHFENFWDSVSDNLSSVADGDTIERLCKELSWEKVHRHLVDENGYSIVFDGSLKGRKRRLEIKFRYLDNTGEMLLATLRDITDSIIMEKLRHDNERDALTDLYNRRKTFRACRALLEEHKEDVFAMLHFDIKHFRLYNTFFGDAAGDKLLCDIADMFRKMDSDYDYWAYGRIESDVFCVLFPINQNKYQKHLNDLMNGLKNYRTDFLIEPAIGIYTVTDKSIPIESMFTRASIAAKTIKTGISDSIVFYNEQMEQKLHDEQMVVNEMQTAIEKEQFKVYLQPKYSLDTEKPVGAEALVRWIHPEKGLISPSQFIPVFEGNGFIADLDRYMWEHVCVLLKKWKDEGKTLLPVSVNVSRISMYSPTTVQFLKDLVKKYNVDPRYLELELTESAYMDDPEDMKKELKELQDFGFHILMDDFGSGYSSLNTLREIPVDCVKLDMKFISESVNDERSRIVLASVVGMSKGLGVSVIAEGVETREQADNLNDLGCEYVQGFFFARPMPVDAYEKLVTREMK